VAVAFSAPAQEDNELVVKLAPPVYKSFLAIKGFTPDDLEVYSIGHSHIDAAWKWRVPETHDKTYNTFSQAVGNMEERPHFTFSQSQPAFYEWTMEDHPELFARMVEMEKRGQWELAGGQWVEPDCNVPDGESFVRQRLLGQRFYLKHFGHITDMAWLPDSFGYNQNLPQIFARSGAKYLWAKKINTNFDTVFPFHNFVWRSPDGSELVTTLNSMSVGLGFFTHQEVGLFREARYLAPEGGEMVADYSWTPREIEGALSDDWFNKIANFYGEGDGDVGPQEVEIQIQEALAERGWTTFTNAKTYFLELESIRDRLPIWTDELYLERHRGTLTTQAWIKRANRAAEQELQTAEAIHAILAKLGGKYPYAALLKLWKMVLFNQFHDILPGSSIPEVYEDARLEYDQIHAGTGELIDSGLNSLASMVNARPPRAGLEPLMVFNSLGWQRSGPVEVPGAESLAIFDESGAEVPSQMIERDGERRLAFRAVEVPSVGYKVYFMGKREGDMNSPGPSVDEGGDDITLENELVKVAIDKRTGHIVSLFDKREGKETIEAASNRILAFRDRHKQHRAWNIDANYQRYPIHVPADAEVEVTAAGPLFAEVRARRVAKHKGAESEFVQTIRLFADDPRVHIDLDADFHMENSLVKIEFNTAFQTETVAADGPYLVIERPTRPSTPAGKARWETSCQKWIDLSDGVSGLALINNGKYGFSLTDSGKGYRLTAIKGAEYPMAYSDAEDVVHYKERELPYTDQGEHHLRLALLPHPGDWREAGLVQAGYNFNNPLRAVPVRSGSGRLPSAHGFISVDSDSVYLGSVKLGEDDGALTLRLVEAHGRPSAARVSLGQGFTFGSAWETDLLELSKNPIPGSGSKLDGMLSPYEIKTVKLDVR